MFYTEPTYRFKVYFKHDTGDKTFLGWMSARSRYEACEKVHTNVLGVCGPNSTYRNRAQYIARRAYVPRPSYIGAYKKQLV